ncbi:MAG: MgtC/SapB family protein [Candidatus Omnitrophota bacterium]|jgi:putative Mg2+ transporter-C (MgtC) family protein
MLNDWIILFRLVLAAILSGAVGFEREFHGRAAGFRTHILLCIGSTLTMLTSMHIFDVYINRVPCDPARIAAGVVTGIGFLGAGTIMRSRGSVRGLTTAASLWVVAGIGLAVGSGLYFGAIVTTVITLVSLFVFSRVERAMIRKDWYKTVVVDTKDDVGQLKAVRDALGEYHTEITDFEVERLPEGGVMRLRIGVRLTTTKHDEQLLNDIARIDGVKHVKWEVN